MKPSKRDRELWDTLSEEMWEYQVIGHQLLHYGTAAVVQAHILTAAQDLVEGTMSLQKFRGKYQIRREPAYLSVSLDAVRADGVFFPKDCYRHSKKTNRKKQFRVDLFNRDYLNVFVPLAWGGKVKECEAFRDTLDRVWYVKDFQDADLVQRALHLSRTMWKRCVECHNYFRWKSTPGPLPKREAAMCQRLIKYYTEVIGGFEGKLTGTGELARELAGGKL